MTWEDRLTFEVSSADLDSATPVWVDFTDRIRDMHQVLEWALGRQNDLDQAEPSQLTLVLENSDDALTYGNTLSPYAAWWGPGRKCRLRETIGTTTIDHLVGYLQVPDELLITTEVEQRVTVSIVDELARLRTAPQFYSALTEYILNTADLVGYWPLDGDAQPFNGLGPWTTPIAVDAFRVSGTGGASAAVQPATGLAPPGGERSSARFSVGLDELGNVASYVQASWPVDFEPAIDATDSVTVVMWIAVTGTTFVSQTIASIIIFGSSTVTLSLKRDLATGAWTLTAAGAMTGSIGVGSVGAGALFPVGIRFTMSPANMELWIGGQRFTTTPTGVPPTTPTLFQGNFGSLPISYDLSHLQAYVGGSYSYSDFQDQIYQGYTPLERQTTGARIRTILGYAGITDTSAIDDGQSVMQIASLAGQTPEEALRDAERTEQGLLYVRGGRVVFKDRRTLYNI